MKTGFPSSRVYHLLCRLATKATAHLQLQAHRNHPSPPLWSARCPLSLPMPSRTLSTMVSWSLKCPSTHLTTVGTTSGNWLVLTVPQASQVTFPDLLCCSSESLSGSAACLHTFGCAAHTRMQSQKDLRYLPFQCCRAAHHGPTQLWL